MSALEWTFAPHGVKLRQWDDPINGFALALADPPGYTWWFTTRMDRAIASDYASHVARRAVDAALADAFASVADRVAMP